ncbi:MAG: hypothetical protein ACLP7P_11130 [Rhodomicrobium sp.]
MVPFASWSVLTTDFLIVLYIMLGGVTLSAILQLAGARWQNELRSVAVSLFGLYPLVLILLVILLAAGKTTFPWIGSSEPEWHNYPFPLLKHVTLPEWNNYQFLIVRQIAGFALVTFLFRRYIKNIRDPKRTRKLAYYILCTYVLYGTMIAWDFEMTLLPEWHSAIYAMYHFISNFGMFMSFTIVLVYILCSSGRLIAPMPHYVFNYVAQMLLAFTMLWAYTFFAQYLTIWYGNLPQENNRIVEMEDGDYSVLWWTFIVLKFFFPFSLLIFDYTRHSVSMIALIACSIMLGTWIERYTWISASYPAGPFVPGYMPMTSRFDIIATLLVAAAGYVLIRKSLVRNQVMRA